VNGDLTADRRVEACPPPATAAAAIFVSASTAATTSRRAPMLILPAMGATELIRPRHPIHRQDLLGNISCEAMRRMWASNFP
jgi:hypothetical protein